MRTLPKPAVPWLAGAALLVALLAGPGLPTGPTGASAATARGQAIAALPAADITIPQAWHGVWEVTRRRVDCATQQVLETTVLRDTMCAGTLFGLPSEVTCAGTITDGAIDISCSSSSEVFPGCSITLNMTIAGSLSGDSYTGTEITNWDYSDGCPLPDQCLRYEREAVRLADDPGCVPTPTDRSSWSSVKGHYR